LGLQSDKFGVFFCPAVRIIGVSYVQLHIHGFFQRFLLLKKEETRYIMEIYLLKPKIQREINGSTALQAACTYAKTFPRAEIGLIQLELFSYYN